MVKIKIELDLNDLLTAHHVSEPKKVDSLPTVPADYNTLEGLNNGKVWYKQYNKGDYKWVRMESRGESPEECGNIIIRLSPGNTDVLNDEEMCYHSKYGDVVYDDYPKNMYVQSERLRQLEKIGYVEGEDNFIELV